MIDFAEPIRERQEMMTALRTRVDEVVLDIMAGRRPIPTDEEIQRMAFETVLPFAARKVARQIVADLFDTH